MSDLNNVVDLYNKILAATEAEGRAIQQFEESYNHPKLGFFEWSKADAEREKYFNAQSDAINEFRSRYYSPVIEISSEVAKFLFTNNAKVGGDVATNILQEYQMTSNNGKYYLELGKVCRTYIPGSRIGPQRVATSHPPQIIRNVEPQGIHENISLDGINKNIEDRFQQSQDPTGADMSWVELAQGKSWSERENVRENKAPVDRGK